MNLLLDTHILIWAAQDSHRLSFAARELITHPDNRLFFSAASLWEIVIKNTLGRENFKINPHILRRNLIDNGYLELPVRSNHTLAVENLPPLHKDPFDRILVAQSIVEGMTLLTADTTVAQYPGAIIQV